jgi:hypothetical protein
VNADAYASTLQNKLGGSYNVNTRGGSGKVLLAVYSAPEMAILALAGLVIAIAGALAPASWAAHSATATALRTE